MKKNAKGVGTRPAVGAYYFDGWGGEVLDMSYTHQARCNVVPGWDRRPWENPADPNQEFCWYHPDRTPEQFAASLRDAVAWMDQHPEKTTAERIVLVYAWNECGEGGHIAPTKGDPDGKYLKALKAVVESDASGDPSFGDISVTKIAGTKRK